jgi:hypothetical protein
MYLQNAHPKNAKDMVFQLYNFIEKKVPLIKDRTGDVARVQGAIAHCISADLHMGAGVARQICQIRAYNRPNDWQKPGHMNQPRAGMLHTVLVTTSPEDNSSQVFNLISKQHYWNHGDYPSMERVLKALRGKMIDHKVPRLSIPKIGCGRDRLEWCKVLPMIEAALFGLVLHVDIYEL